MASSPWTSKASEFLYAHPGQDVSGFQLVTLGSDQSVTLASPDSTLHISVALDGYLSPLAPPPGSLFARSWATPVPPHPALAADSEAMVQEWVAQMDGAPPGVNHLGSAGLPIYTAGSSATTTPEVDKQGACDPYFPSDTGPIPIPPGAMTSGVGDSPLIVYDASEGRDWELWQAVPTGSGHWQACDGGYLADLSRTPGVWSDGFGLSATGDSYLGTLITEADIASGSIRHVMAFTLRDGSCDSFAAPATRSDSNCVARNEPPEGTILFMPPTVVMPSGLTPFAQMVYVALEQYGLVLTDSSGSFVLAESESSCDWPVPSCGSGLQLQANATDPLTISFAGLPEYQALSGIPWNRLEATRARRLQLLTAQAFGASGTESLSRSSSIPSSMRWTSSLRARIFVPDTALVRNAASPAAVSRASAMRSAGATTRSTKAGLLSQGRTARPGRAPHASRSGWGSGGTGPARPPTPATPYRSTPRSDRSSIRPPRRCGSRRRGGPRLPRPERGRCRRPPPGAARAAGG